MEVGFTSTITDTKALQVAAAIKAVEPNKGGFRYLLY
jgi:hypothetical protein